MTDHYWASAQLGGTGTTGQRSDMNGFYDRRGPNEEIAFPESFTLAQNGGTPSTAELTELSNVVGDYVMCSYDEIANNQDDQYKDGRPVYKKVITDPNTQAEIYAYYSYIKRTIYFVNVHSGEQYYNGSAMVTERKVWHLIGDIAVGSAISSNRYQDSYMTGGSPLPFEITAVGSDYKLDVNTFAHLAPGGGSGYYYQHRNNPFKVICFNGGMWQLYNYKYVTGWSPLSGSNNQFQTINGPMSINYAGRCGMQVINGTTIPIHGTINVGSSNETDRYLDPTDGQWSSYYLADSSQVTGGQDYPYGTKQLLSVKNYDTTLTLTNFAVNRHPDFSYNGAQVTPVTRLFNGYTWYDYTINVNSDPNFLDWCESNYQFPGDGAACRIMTSVPFGVEVHSVDVASGDVVFTSLTNGGTVPTSTLIKVAAPTSFTWFHNGPIAKPGIEYGTMYIDSTNAVAQNPFLNKTSVNNPGPHKINDVTHASVSGYWFPGNIVARSWPHDDMRTNTGTSPNNTTFPGTFFDPTVLFSSEGVGTRFFVNINGESQGCVVEESPYSPGTYRIVLQ